MNLTHLRTYVLVGTLTLLGCTDPEASGRDARADTSITDDARAVAETGGALEDSSIGPSDDAVPPPVDASIPTGPTNIWFPYASPSDTQVYADPGALMARTGDRIYGTRGLAADLSTYSVIVARFGFTNKITCDATMDLELLVADPTTGSVYGSVQKITISKATTTPLAIGGYAPGGTGNKVMLIYKVTRGLPEGCVGIEPAWGSQNAVYLR